MSVSLCMIAKNEEQTIQRAIESTRGLVDEIIVVDTGSTDSTLAIAKKLGAITYSSPWTKDFSYHRNQSLALATCDWILFLDCDEALDKKNLKLAKDLLNTAPTSCKAYNLSLTNIIHDQPVDCVTSLRVFRNHHHFSFEGIIHEQIQDSITSQYGPTSISSLPLTLLHFGYDPDIVKAKDKINRNLELLLSITPKTGYLYTMIGDCYYKSNQIHEAITYYEQSLALDSSLTTNYTLTLSLNYTSCLILIRAYEKAWQFIQNALVRQPYFNDLYFLACWILKHLHHYSLSLSYLNQYLSHQKDSHYLQLKQFTTLHDLSALRNSLLSSLNQSL